MKGYLAILRGRLLALLQYRSAVMAGLVTQIFWGIIKIMILTAFYAQSTSSEPITLSQAITFIWIGQALLQLLPWNVDKELEMQVKNGNIAYELLRPLNLYGLIFSRALAMRLLPTLLRSIPVIILAGLFLELSAPVSWAAGMAFGASLVNATLLSTAMTTMVIISLFWTISGEGIQRLIPHVTMLLSGMVVPLPLFPEWMQPFLNLQPFRGILDIPSRIYTGVIPIAEIHYYLGFQLIWFLFFVASGKYLIEKAMKRFVIQGG